MTDDTLGLSPQEVRVIRLAARGYTNWEIGVLLGIASNTVRSHLEHAQDKLTLDPVAEPRWLARVAFQLARAECALARAA